MGLIIRAFGGLGAECYIRHFLFGLMFTAFALYVLLSSRGDVPVEAFVFTAANTALYPYSRQAYEWVIDFIVGRNVFFWNSWLYLFLKLITMFGCWLLAIFVAPPMILALLVRAWWQRRVAMREQISFRD